MSVGITSITRQDVLSHCCNNLVRIWSSSRSEYGFFRKATALSAMLSGSRNPLAAMIFTSGWTCCIARIVVGPSIIGIIISSRTTAMSPWFCP